MSGGTNGLSGIESSRRAFLARSAVATSAALTLGSATGARGLRGRA